MFSPHLLANSTASIILLHLCNGANGLEQLAGQTCVTLQLHKSVRLVIHKRW